MKQSIYVKNGSCPDCGSRRGLATYTDHTYCFSCNTYRNDHKVRTEFLLEDKSKSDAGKIKLPEDCVQEFPPSVMAWLGKYDISLEEIKKHRICYSPSRQFLIFPFYDQSKLVFWQGRNFKEIPTGENVRYFKYFTRGKILDLLPVFFYEDNAIDTTIVLVEDVISALKVSRVNDCLPLFGCHVDKELINRLSKLYTNITLWLDKDKQNTYVNYVSLMKILFDNVRLVYTNKDPKEYSEFEIKSHLFPETIQ